MAAFKSYCGRFIYLHFQAVYGQYGRATRDGAGDGLDVGVFARSSQHSVFYAGLPEMMVVSDPQKVPTTALPESDLSANHHFFPLQNDIFPCLACGEIFQKPQMLEQHQALKHVVSELISGWTSGEKIPKILRILKIRNSSKILARFEEYQESVKSKAARNGGTRKCDDGE